MWANSVLQCFSTFVIYLLKYFYSRNNVQNLKFRWWIVTESSLDATLGQPKFFQQSLSRLLYGYCDENSRLLFLSIIVVLFMAFLLLGFYFRRMLFLIVRLPFPLCAQIFSGIFVAIRWFLRLFFSFLWKIFFPIRWFMERLYSILLFMVHLSR
jgi:hypothetical protein